MAQKSSGMRNKTRKKLTKDSGKEGVIDRFLQDFDDGESVRIEIDPAVQDGMPHPRFDGRTGTVEEQRGSSYVVTVPDGGKTKTFTAHPAHLTPAE